MSELKGLINLWVSPTGRIVFRDKEFFAEYAWHDELASCILRDLWKLKSALDAFVKVHEKKIGNTCIEELEKLGWIRLHGYGGLTPVWIVPLGRKLTKKQEGSILEWCIDNDRNYDNCFAK